MSASRVMLFAGRVRERLMVAGVPSQAPTLLIVGGADTAILDLNQRAQTQLKCESHLAVVPGATYLFPEPAALGQVTGLAADWFGRHFARADAIAAAA